MKKCFTVNCMRNNDDFDGYEKLISEGIYQGVELFFPYNVSLEQRDLYNKRVDELIEKCHPEVVLHLPHGKNNDLICENKEEVFQRMCDAISYAASKKAKRLTLHLGSYPLEMSREEAINKVTEVVKKLCEFAYKYNLDIMIENMPSERELGYSPEEILYIIKRTHMPNIKFILDTGHANCSKYDLLDYVDILQDYLSHMHFSDNNGLTDEHKRVNSGTIDFVSLFKALNKINYNKLHCMEVLFKNYTDLIEYAKDIDIYDKYYR